jgi:hypothetical protein
MREFSFFHHCLGNGSSEREIVYCCVRNGPQVFSYIKERGEAGIEMKGGKRDVRNM